MDKITPERRSRNMARIRSADTKPEMVVRGTAHALGYRYRLHVASLPGKPDLVFPGRRKVIFVHGCFWHQHSSTSCRVVRVPKSALEYWGPKLARNVSRDARNLEDLDALGWRVLVIWECESRDRERLARKLTGFLDGEP